jgi:hypothetical protein
MPEGQQGEERLSLAGAEARQRVAVHTDVKRSEQTDGQLVAVGLAVSAIACWGCKYTYWVLRPVTAIRTLTGQPFYDPDFLTPIVTPPFPAYTSGHATFSGCSAAVLEHLFPGGKVTDAFGQSVGFAAAADQAAVSRLYGGIHYRSDNEEGLRCGRSVASRVIRRAQGDKAS